MSNLATMAVYAALGLGIAASIIIISQLLVLVCEKIENKLKDL